MAPTPKGTSPAVKLYCGLGNHRLQPPHKTITDERMLSFAKKINNEIRSDSLLCEKCFNKLQDIYKSKLQKAVQFRKQIHSKQGSSISDVSLSQQPHSQSQGSIGDIAHVTATSNSTTVSSTTGTTSTMKRNRLAPLPDDDDEMLSLNAFNGTRCPQYQPIPKRQPTVHLNKEAMDIYLAGTTGG